MRKSAAESHSSRNNSQPKTTQVSWAANTTVTSSTRLLQSTARRQKQSSFRENFSAAGSSSQTDRTHRKPLKSKDDANDDYISSIISSTLYDEDAVKSVSCGHEDGESISCARCQMRERMKGDQHQAENYLAQTQRKLEVEAPSVHWHHNAGEDGAIVLHNHLSPLSTARNRDDFQQLAPDSANDDDVNIDPSLADIQFSNGEDKAKTPPFILNFARVTNQVKCKSFYSHLFIDVDLYMIMCFMLHPLLSVNRSCSYRIWLPKLGLCMQVVRLPKL